MCVELMRNGIIGMWEPERLGRSNFQMLEISLSVQGDLTARLSALIPRKNGAQSRVTLPRISTRSGHGPIFSRFSTSLSAPECRLWRRRKSSSAISLPGGPGSKLLYNDQFAFQDRLIDSVVRSAESHIPRSGAGSTGRCNTI